ncbi:ras-like GTP-binding protein Rho1 isoform X1 [Ixodes scapularis]|uniref:ras-like GTP-binding protein Rho1 isoform X1 n=1 Tax=Ixodes scapularis TaxID=6945 RepID=UPI001C38302F|nr:ras-like GTP-binding protein Rho1 isoform X1 [Ixodes scapularis]
MTKTKMADGDQPVDRKLVAVGDGSCGKTCLLISYCSEEFPTSYVPTVFETYSSIVQWCQQRVRLSLWDTAGEEDYDRLRPLSYSQASAVLVCFALDNRDSFVNVEFKWEPEIRHYLPKVPIVLVGNKLDLRESHMVPEVRPRNYKPPVSTREGRSLAERIRASAYVECSALTRQNIPEVFDAAIKASLQSVKYKKTLRCTLL